MQYKEYSEIVSLLKSVEVQPPFEEIRAMVLADRRTRKAPVLAFRMLLMAIIPVTAFLSLTVAPGTIGLSRFSANHGLPFEQVLRSTTGSQSAELSTSASLLSSEHYSDLTLGTNTTSSSQRSFSNTSSIVSSVSKRLRVGISITPAEAELDNTNDITSTTPRSWLIPSAVVPPVEFIAGELAFQLPSTEPMHAELKLKDFIVSEHLPFTFIGSGAYTPLMPTVSFGDRLLASAALRYQLTSNAAIVFELRRNLFLQKYFDTATIVSNSNTGVSNLSSQSSLDVLSLGTGIHIDMTELSLFTPYAEAMVGICSRGTVVAQSFGVSYAFSGPFTLETSVRADELFTSSGAPRAAFSFGLGVGYSW